MLLHGCWTRPGRPGPGPPTGNWSSEYTAVAGRRRNYHFRLIAEERQAGSTLLQRLALVNVTTDREVWMLYSSFLRALGPVS